MEKKTKVGLFILGFILALFLLTSCEKGNVDGHESGILAIQGEKIEFDGKHFILFTRPNDGGAIAITLDPDFHPCSCNCDNP